MITWTNNHIQAGRVQGIVSMTQILKNKLGICCRIMNTIFKIVRKTLSDGEEIFERGDSDDNDTDLSIIHGRIKVTIGLLMLILKTVRLFLSMTLMLKKWRMCGSETLIWKSQKCILGKWLWVAKSRCKNCKGKCHQRFSRVERKRKSVRWLPLIEPKCGPFSSTQIMAEIVKWTNKKIGKFTRCNRWSLIWKYN